MVGVHVSQLALVEENDLILASLLTLANLCGDDTLGFFTKSRITVHLFVQEIEVVNIKSLNPNPHTVSVRK